MALTTQQLITQLYVGYYNRAPDPEGLNYWIGRVNAGVSLADIADSFAASPEAIATYPFLALPNVANAENFLTQVYQNLFNRAPDADGLAYYAGKLSSGQTTPGQIIAEIQANANTNTNNTDGQILGNKVAVGLSFAETAANTPGFQYNDSAAGFANTVLDNVTADAATVVAATSQVNVFLGNNQNVGTTYALTTAADVIDGTSKDDTINGLVDTSGATSTLSVSDVINGNVGTDKLNLTVVGTAVGALPAANISNVEIFNIRDLNTSGGTSAYNFALVNGEQQVWADRSTAAVDLQSLGDGAVVGVRGNGTTTNGAVTFSMATPASAVSIALEGGLVGSPSVSATAGSATSATISSSGAANTAGTIDVSAGTTVTTLTVNAATNLTATLAADYVATGADLKVSGAAASVSLGAAGTFKTIDASGLTAGGITIETDTVTSSVVGGAGRDVVTLAGLTAAGTVNLGAGNDSLLGATAPAAGASIDGGAGRDTVASTLINAGNGAKFLNFEVLGLAGSTLDLNLLTGSSIEALELVAGGSGTFSNVKLTQALEVTGSAGGATTLNFAGATGAADAYAITFNASTTGTVAAPTAVNANTVNLAGVENITINSGSAAGVNANSITLGGVNAETVTVTGSQALTLGFAATFGSNTDGAEVTAINGSAATGALAIDIANVTADAAGLTVSGGSAADTLTTSTFSATLTGNGGNDNFVVGATVAATTDASTAAMATIADFTKGDTISLVDASGTTTFTSAKLDVSSATTLDGAVDLATATNVVANDALVSWFQYGGNTYVVQDLSASTTLAATDVVVKLAGLLDLSTATVSAADVLSWA